MFLFYQLKPGIEILNNKYCKVTFGFENISIHFCRIFMRTFNMLKITLESLSLIKSF